MMHYINPLNAELNPICHLLALLGAHHILHVSRVRVKMADINLVVLRSGGRRNSCPSYFPRFHFHKSIWWRVPWRNSSLCNFSSQKSLLPSILSTLPTTPASRYSQYVSINNKHQDLSTYNTNTSRSFGRPVVFTLRRVTSILLGSPVGRLPLYSLWKGCPLSFIWKRNLDP